MGRSHVISCLGSVDAFDGVRVERLRLGRVRTRVVKRRNVVHVVMVWVITEVSNDRDQNPKLI